MPVAGNSSIDNNADYICLGLQSVDKESCFYLKHSIFILIVNQFAG